MKNTKLMTIALTLFLALACTDSEKKTVEEAINNNTPQAVFTAATDGTINSHVTVQGAHGTCVISNDYTHITYTKTDANYQGYDSCETDETIDLGCGPEVGYSINLGAPTPALTRWVTPC